VPSFSSFASLFFVLFIGACNSPRQSDITALNLLFHFGSLALAVKEILVEENGTGATLLKSEDGWAKRVLFGGRAWKKGRIQTERIFGNCYR